MNDSNSEKQKIVGYVYEERCMWHRPQILMDSESAKVVQPFQHWESPETKRRFHNLLVVSKLIRKLVHLQDYDEATKELLELAHTSSYIKDIEKKSKQVEGSYASDYETSFAQHAFELASLAVGGTLYAVDQVLKKNIDSAYVLCRPPGHHSNSSKGLGFCIFNNIAIAAKYLLNKKEEKIKKIAIVDYDVHHGNGTQDIFYDDGNVLFISIHQDSNYPSNSGLYNEIGTGKGVGTTINVPLPPGSGKGAYHYTFETIVLPALQNFQPDFILVSSGFDGSYADPLSAMILSSDDFRYMASALVDISDRLCDGRIVFVHEGGYSESYVPFCGVAVIESMLGMTKTNRNIVKDPFLGEVKSWGGQDLQRHQWEIINQVASIHSLPKSEQWSEFRTIDVTA